MKGKDARVKTYVKGLDERLSDGLPKESIILVCGTAGSMKSSFVYSVLYNNAKNENINGLYITMEQSSESLLSQAGSLGMGKLENIYVFDLAGMRAQYGDLVSRKLVAEAREIAPGIPETRMDWFDTILEFLKQYKKKHNFELLAIDSLNAIYALVPTQEPRSRLFEFFSELRKLKSTTFLTSEMTRIDSRYSTFGVEEFLVDGIIHLDIVKEGWNVKRYLNVVKLRRTKHDMDFYPLLVGKEGFEIVTK